jgi:hypothetical protein
MAEQKPKPKFQIHDNPAVVEAYANKFIGSMFDGGAVALTFGSIRLLPEKTDEAPRDGQQPAVYVTHRLALSPAAAVELVSGLNSLLANLQQAQAAAVHQRTEQSR